MQVGKNPNERNVQAYGHSRPTYRGDNVQGEREAWLYLAGHTEIYIVATLTCVSTVFKVRGFCSGEDFLFFVDTVYSDGASGLKEGCFSRQEGRYVQICKSCLAEIYALKT
jgi:hypothetical protein